MKTTSTSAQFTVDKTDICDTSDPDGELIITIDRTTIDLDHELEFPMDVWYSYYFLFCQETHI